MLRRGLTAWAGRCPLPLVLFFDEIGALQGDSLISVLSQLRDGYTARPDPFPHSVVLCGLRDVRDYKAASGGDSNRLGTSSPFNIKAACQLVFLGFLHRVVNGGGCIDREYGVGRGRIDVVIRWPCTDANGDPTSQWEAVELKVRHPGRPDPLPEGLAQLDGYLDRLGLDTGTLIIFDRRPDAPPLPDRTGLGTAHTPAGRRVTLLRA